MAPTHYQVLDVSPGATLGQVRRAYKLQAHRWHPDKHQGSPAAHARFVQVQQAYAVLSDPARRAQYDAGLANPRVATPAPEPRPAPPTAAPASAPRPPPPTTARRRKGDDLYVEAVLDWGTLGHGGPAEVSGLVGQCCPRCLGGCAYCGFGGQVLRPRQWRLQVPADYQIGEWLRLPEAGHQGPFFARPGDVFVRFRPPRAWGWRWSAFRARLERQVWWPRHAWVPGQAVEIKTPWGAWVPLVLPACPAPGEGLWCPLLPPGAPLAGQVWVRLRSAPGFSWGARRARSVE